MTAARALFAVARFALFLAVFVIVGGTAVRVLHRPAPRVENGATTVDNRVDFPGDWEAYPVVAKLRTDDVKTITSSDAMFSATDTQQAPLGDVVVRYMETFCTAGGSSCTGASRNFFNLSVGDLDANGSPAITTDADCSATPNLAYARMGEIHECAPSSLTLRRSNDGKISVVTFVDPEPTEKPIAAFTRSVVAHSQAPLNRRVKWLCFFALAFLVGGTFALFKSRRFFGARGILTWREGCLARNVVTCGEFSAVVPHLNLRHRSLLIDPAAIANAQSYRAAPAIDRSAIFFGTKSEALTRAQMSALLSASLHFASAGIAALCAAFVLF